MSDMCNSANRHSIVSNGQSFEIVEWFYLGDTIGIKGGGGGGVYLTVLQQESEVDGATSRI